MIVSISLAQILARRQATSQQHLTSRGVVFSQLSPTADPALRIYAMPFSWFMSVGESVPVSLVLDYASIPRTHQKSIALLLTEKSK